MTTGPDREARLLSRRRFGLGTASVALLLGCGEDRLAPSPAAGGGGSGPGSAGGSDGGVNGGAGGGEESELLGLLPFSDDGDIPLETPLNVGWDGRLYTDLSRLDPDALVTPNGSFYIRTRYPDRLDPDAPWTIAVDGLVDEAATLALEDLLPLAAPRGVHLLECSGNGRGGAFGLMSAAAWGGIRMADLLARVRARPEATRVLVEGFDGHSQPSANGHSTPGASWIFTFAQLESAFLATTMNGEALPPDHGAPLRLFVPGWYGCTAIKWVQRIALVGEDTPATAQMQEFASRTHQDGVPVRAADYRPAIIEHAAMPVRVERRREDGQVVLRVFGILWGGSELTAAVSIRFGDAPWEPVTVAPPPTTNTTWTLWSHTWRPTRTGAVPLRMRIDDPSIPTRRLDADYYLRTIAI